VRRPVAILFAAAGLLLAQAPPASGPLAKPLVYAGKPLPITPNCRPEDLSALGLSCSTEEPCRILLELTAAETVGTRVLLIGNLHTSSVTLESLLLASEDGITWTEAYERIPAATLDQIQFLDFEAGWISGQVVTTLPRDPFFLISDNGGKSWHRHPVYREPRAGLIESFWFESRKQGAMIIDRLQADENGIRYELHQSLTGGESWDLQRLSEKPIVLKHPPKTERSVRLQADSSSQTYQLQQRSGDNWKIVAAFAISAGECRAPETQLVEPEPSPPPPDKPEPPKAGKKK